MNKTVKIIILAILSGIIFASVGCDSDSDSERSDDIVGTWLASYTGGTYQSATVILFSNGRGQFVTPGGTGSGTYSLSGSNVSMTASAQGQIINYSGILSAGGQMISGAWSDNRGGAGTFTLSRQNDGGGNTDSGGNAVITQAEYNQIQLGMSYDQVVSIVGNEGQIVQSGGGTLIVHWQNYSPASYATVGFFDGLVEIKDSSGNLP